MPGRPEVQLRLPNNYNEVMDGALPRDPYGPMLDTLAHIGTETLARRIEMANEINRREGVTFSLNPTDGDRILPVDWLPRIIPADHWDTIERGLKQRITALNLLCHDVYNGRQTIVPEEILATCPYFYPECIGLRVPHDIYIHVYGPDLLHLGNGKYVVLEDNTRIPSGVSYAVKYREVTKRVIPELFRPYRIRRIDDYGQVFLRNLHYFAEGRPHASTPPVMVLLTEGTYNAAYYEHKFLSEQMGLPLVEPSDLYIDDDLSCRLHTFDGSARVDLIYRRIQDLETFVPSLVRAYAAGQVGLVNAWGTGIVDDKTVFPYVPALIRHYLGEEPILPNVESYSLAEPAVRRHVLANLGKMVVKSREGYGGHDMLIGPESTRAEQQAFRDKILARPLNYIAQDCVEFSTHLICRTSDRSRDGTHGAVSLTDSYVDLRAYVLYGQDITVLPGGISRVAQPGTHVVNSSSGGLVKDTWVLEEGF